MQKHKSWGCSGKRDPTAYVKKTQLVTPSGVDHDFNFISGIERSRDRAGEHLQGQSIQNAQSRSARLNQPSFRNRLQLARVNIEYAPLGMTRQKLNKTRLTQVCHLRTHGHGDANRMKSKRINWTVEWLHEDNTSSIGSIFDDEQVHKAYLPLYYKRTGVPRKKRKRDDEPTIASGNLDGGQDMIVPLSDDPSSAKEETGELPTLKVDHEGVEDKEPLTTLTEDDSLSVATTATTAATDAQAHTLDAPMNDASKEQDAAMQEGPDHDKAAGANEVVDESSFQYYLVKPRTTGTEKVLIPLSPTDTFLTCLQNQTVLEFPTIQVLGAGLEELPAGFVTEDSYASKFRKEAHDLEQLIKEEGEIDSGDISTADKSSDPHRNATDVDAKTAAMPTSTTLLATLERDMQRN